MEEIIQKGIVEELIEKNGIKKEISKLNEKRNVTKFKIEKNPPIIKPTKELTEKEIQEISKRKILNNLILS